MQVTSYTFRTPYPQHVQVGLPDPASIKEEDKVQNPVVAAESQNKESSEGKIKPTLNSGIVVSLGALEAGNSQKSVSEFKSLVSIDQGKKAYAQEN